MIEIENIPEDQEIYLRDNLTNTYFDLRSGAYSFSSEVSAEDTERFDIVFEPGETLGTEEFANDNTIIFVNNTEDMLYVKGLTSQAKQLNITNMLGQNIKSFKNISNQTLENGLDISSLSSGVYLVYVQGENGTQISKKIILDWQFAINVQRGEVLILIDWDFFIDKNHLFNYKSLILQTYK